ncbi:hypothetical protein [Paenibacillus sp. Soil750]|uniref:hypothetical protein n=1 Tax=Paenibacillus sp. Soil750 TaxID=1736398 RepID=UPI0012FA810B|nr:hypothetical protein [Paenibacillus sp. Soil750]
MITEEEAKKLMGRALREPIHRVTLPYSYQLFQALKATDLQEYSFGIWPKD